LGEKSFFLIQNGILQSSRASPQSNLRFWKSQVPNKATPKISKEKAKGMRAEKLSLEGKFIKWYAHQPRSYGDGEIEKRNQKDREGLSDF